MKNEVYEHQIIVYNKITAYFYIEKSNILQNNKKTSPNISRLLLLI